MAKSNGSQAVKLDENTPVALVYKAYTKGLEDIGELEAMLKATKKLVATATPLLIPVVKALKAAKPTEKWENHKGGLDDVKVVTVTVAQRAACGPTALIELVATADEDAGKLAQEQYDAELKRQQEDIAKHPKTREEIEIEPAEPALAAV